MSFRTHVHNGLLVEVQPCRFGGIQMRALAILLLSANLVLTTVLPLVVPHPYHTPSELPHAPTQVADASRSIYPSADTVSTPCVLSKISLGTFTIQMLFDPMNGYLYASNPDSVYVINTTTLTLVTSISLYAWGLDPGPLALNPSKDIVYAANTASSSVEEINGATNQVVANVSASQPSSLAFDDAHGLLYVASDRPFALGGKDGQLNVFNSSTDSLVAKVQVGISPNALTVDPESGLVFVGNLGSDNVSVVSGTSHAVINSISTGTSPYSLTFDESNGYVYSNGGTPGNSTGQYPIISGTTGSAVDTLPVPWVGDGSNAMVADPVNSQVYVGGSVTATGGHYGPSVVIMNLTTKAVVGTISMSAPATTMALDTRSGKVFAASGMNGFLYIISTGEGCPSNQAPLPFWSSPITWMIIGGGGVLLVLAVLIIHARSKRRRGSNACSSPLER